MSGKYAKNVIPLHNGPFVDATILAHGARSGHGRDDLPAPRGGEALINRLSELFGATELTQDSPWGIGEAGGPDPSRVGRDSVGWLSMRVERGFAPVKVVMPISAWQATWSLH